jgi:Gpi18-like mannosyltransferase
LKSIDWGTVALILGIKVLVFGFAALSVRTLKDESPGFAEMWHRWDSWHYRVLAEFGYSSTGEERFSLVFYPLYPWLVRCVAFVVRDFFAAAVIVSGIASVAAGLLLQRLATLDAPAAAARNAVWFLFIFPTSYFLHIGYTESLFLAFVVGCVLAARQNCWALAGLLGACACFTRVNGLILGPTLVVEAWLQYRATRRIDWRWLWIGAVGLGFVAYLALNYQVTGDPFAFSKLMEERWFKKFTPPWIGVRDVWLRIEGVNLTEGLHEFLFIVLGFLCTVWCWLRLRASYATWMTLNWLLITSTAFVLSVPRYLLTFFPIFILFALLGTKRPVIGMLMTACSLLFLALFASKFVQGTWAF